MKKAFALLLALALLLPPAVLAEETDVMTYTQLGVTYRYIFLRNGRIKLVERCVADQGVTTVNIPSTIDGHEVERIGAFAFDGCQASRITIPSTVTTIEVHAFNACTEIQSITIPKGIFFIEGNPFTACRKLVSIALERETGKDHDTLEVTTDGALYSKRNRMLLCYPYARQGANFSVKEGTLVIGKSAFYGCDRLETVVLPATVTKISDWAFLGCDQLRSISLPTTLSSIGELAFAGCRTLKQIAIPEQVARVEVASFFNCSSLGSVILPENLVYIGPRAFLGCESIREIHVPSRVSFIGDEAFSGCRELRHAYIPASVTGFGAGIFEAHGVRLQLHVGRYTFAEIYAINNGIYYTYDNNDDFLTAGT